MSDIDAVTHLAIPEELRADRQGGCVVVSLLITQTALLLPGDSDSDDVSSGERRSFVVALSPEVEPRLLAVLVKGQMSGLEVTSEDLF